MAKGSSARKSSRLARAFSTGHAVSQTGTHGGSQRGVRQNQTGEGLKRQIEPDQDGVRPRVGAGVNGRGEVHLRSTGRSEGCGETDGAWHSLWRARLSGR